MKRLTVGGRSNVQSRSSPGRPALPRPRGRRPTALLTAALAAVLALTLITAKGAEAISYTPINGAGSTWSANALYQWARDVQQNGLTVNYNSTGSSDGRKQFINGTVDFGISEIPFQTHPTDGSYPENPTRPYAYMPIVAGGTSFMYHLQVGNTRITDIRLSGETVAKMFTGAITSWADPEITRDYGTQLPAIPVTPVVRADGSGTTAQFTLWMSREYPSIWNAFCARESLPTPCGLTSQYPTQGTSAVAKSGSVDQANYVAAPYANGTIAYIEYSYALYTPPGWPVVSLLNAAGYYVQPTQYDVAVALTRARIDEDRSSADYLTQILDGVYTNPDARAYPLSSYSYMILPTTTAAPFTTAKGLTLSTFANYFLCQGQQKAGPLGYSPLPVNLVQAGFAQIRRIPGATAEQTDLSACNNPTFDPTDLSKNKLAEEAPQPAACQRDTAPRCGTTAPEPSSPAQGSTTSAAPAPTRSTSTESAAPRHTRRPTTTPITPRDTSSGSTPSRSRAATATIAASPFPSATSPVTIAGSSSGDGGSVGGPADSGNAAPVAAGGAEPIPVDLTANRVSGGLAWALGVTAAIELVLAATLPPVIAARRRRAGRDT